MKTKYLSITLVLLIAALFAFIGCSDSVNSYESPKIYLAPIPADDQVEVSYFLSDESTVTLTIADNFGREVINVFENQIQDRGGHGVNIKLNSIPSGDYYCILSVNGIITIKEFTIIR